MQCFEMILNIKYTSTILRENLYFLVLIEYQNSRIAPYLLWIEFWDTPDLQISHVQAQI